MRVDKGKLTVERSPSEAAWCYISADPVAFLLVGYGRANPRTDMATIVSFHAHPDDESISTGGTLAKAAAEGHRVVVVVATRGEHGEVSDGMLAPGEELAQRREKETTKAARILGVHRLEFLDYVDSGIMGAASNDAAGSFWRVDVDEAADRVAAILVEEQADILTVYDARGVTGHPDHIQATV